MKRPFDLLVLDKEPIEYVEHSVVMLKDNRLLALSQTETRYIPPATTLLLFLGPGSSITSDAARFCAKHDMYVGFVRGGANVHSLWHCGRWPDPKRFVAQVNKQQSEKERLYIAKNFVNYRFSREGADQSYIDKILTTETINQLMSLEAVWAKELYKRTKLQYKVSFTRDKDSHDGVNGSLSLLNNVLYSIINAIILSCNLHPSIGFLHGSTRRGGLAFDIADIYKKELTIIPAFNEYSLDPKIQMVKLSQRFKKNGYFILKDIIQILTWIVGEGDWKYENNLYRL